MENEKLEPDILSGFIPLLKDLRSIKRPLDAAPTFTPQNFLDQIQIFDDAGDKYLAIYIDGAWHSFPGTLIT
jgi:hypothetical protein